VIERQLNRTLGPGTAEAGDTGGAPLPLPGRSARTGIALGASPVAMAMPAPASGLPLPARNPMLMHNGLAQDLPLAPALPLADTDSGVSIDAAAPLAAPAPARPAVERGPVEFDASSPEAFVKSIWPAARET